MAAGSLFLLVSYFQKNKSLERLIYFGVVKALRGWVIVLPILGLGLALFSLARMDNELSLFDKIKKRHREYQAELHGIAFSDRKSAFRRDVKLYLGALAVVTLIDILAILLAWLPNL